MSAKCTGRTKPGQRDRLLTLPPGRSPAWVPLAALSRLGLRSAPHESPSPTAKNVESTPRALPQWQTLFLVWASNKANTDLIPEWRPRREAPPDNTTPQFPALTVLMRYHDNG